MFGFNRPYVRNYGAQFTPVYLPGENYSFYFNSAPIDDVSLPWELWVINGDGVQVKLIGELDTVFVAGTVGYNLYMNNFVFPIDVADGYYQFQLYAPSLGVEKYRSGTILVNSFCLDTTTPVKFRHNDQLFGVHYDLLPDFYQMFRLPINQIEAVDPKSERTQYRQASNGRELRNDKSFLDLQIHLEFYFASDDDFGAVAAMLEHTDISIAGNRIISLDQVKVTKAASQSNLNKGTFTVIPNLYNLPNTIEFYGDFILWGGTPRGDYELFLDGGTP